MLSSVHEHKRNGIALWKKYVLNELPSSISWNAVGCKFSVGEPTTYIK